MVQITPALALCEQHPDQLRPRRVVAAVHMSGTREVRPDRAGPPPPGHLERDDMLVIDEAIEAGWIEHIIFRDADRIARKQLPGETLLDRWTRNKVGLWLCAFGRQMDLVAERLLLTTLMMVSTEERNSITRRLQMGAINKGPMQGLGWPGKTRFGFRRQKHTQEIEQDPAQWPYIRRAFELASGGACTNKKGLSTREVTERLAEEGCPFDHDRVRKILQDPIYATGEFSVTVRGIEWAQKPVALTDPVPLEQFLEVKNLLSLRRGREERTPIGEFLLNTVDTVHAQCDGERDKLGRRILIKGAVREKSPHLRRYRHGVGKPAQCQHAPFVWERDDIEIPIVREIRRLIEHPEVARALITAEARHAGPTSPRLKPHERAELMRQIEATRVAEEAAINDSAKRISQGEVLTPDFVDTLNLLRAGISKERDRLERRLPGG